MKPWKLSTFACLVAAVLFVLAGCNGGNADSDNSTAGSDHSAESAGHDADGHGHAHPAHGPHDGDLIELGNEDYHAELVHSDNDEIVIYILGSDAKTAAPIDAAEVTVNAVRDGTPEQFKVAASPEAGDPEGKSSRFVSSDAELSGHVHEEGAKAKLVVVIDGKQFTGEIAHEGEHAHEHE